MQLQFMNKHSPEMNIPFVNILHIACINILSMDIGIFPSLCLLETMMFLVAPALVLMCDRFLPL